MLSLIENIDRSVRLCDGMSRRESMRIGGLSALGLSLPQLLHGQTVHPASHSTAESFGKAKSVILFWLLGGPPQHETWDPKPGAASEIRGDFGAISTAVPGTQIGELMPKSALLADQMAILRAVVTKDQAHSSSGYQMLTGVPHIPLSQENVTSRSPNLAPSHAAMMRALRADRDGLPSSIVLPWHIANEGEIVWPGQGAGILGRKHDPWLLKCDPSEAGFSLPDLALPEDVSPVRLAARRSLLENLHRENMNRPGSVSSMAPSQLRWHLPEQATVTGQYERKARQAFDLVSGSAARRAFSLHEESEQTRDRYGRYRFGQSCLLARRLVEAGVSLVQVNWTRVAGAANNGTWDTHRDHCQSLKSFLLPMADQSFSALLQDLKDRGLLEETMVVWIGEFGHTPRINSLGGRDHWGNCFSIAMAGGGIRGGTVYGESDAQAGFPVSDAVSPADITATIFHCLGYAPEHVLHDQTSRPVPLSRGEVIRSIIV